MKGTHQMAETKAFTYANMFLQKKNPHCFRSLLGEPMIQFEIQEKLQTFAIKSVDFQEFLFSFFSENEVHISDRTLQDVLSVLRGKAFRSKIKTNVFIRVGFSGNDLFIDLNNKDTQFVKISNGTWTISNECQLPFLRSTKQLPLPLPIRTSKDAFMDLFQKQFNLRRPQEILLLLTAILKAINLDKGAYVLMVLIGQMGSGKSTASNIIKSLVDPTEPLLLAPPKSSDDILAVTGASHFIAIDNISGMTSEMSDIFCRIVYGTGTSKRKLYTDNTEALYKSFNPILFNGISDISERPDFQDRSIIFEMAKISFENRKSEAEIKAEFEAAHPILLGGLYTLLAECRMVLTSVRTTGLNRMTEFHRMGIALEQVLGLAEGEFTRRYDKAILDIRRDQFWENEICCLIYEFLTTAPKGFLSEGTRPTKLEGTALEILRILNRKAGSNRSYNLPKTPQGLSKVLARLEPLFNDHGIIICRNRNSDARTICIKFENPNTLPAEALNIL